jgi:uncharacterized protein (TIGR02996 family)
MHEMESAFLNALHADPADEASWLALADWLHEDGQADRAEVVRLWRGLRHQRGPQSSVPSDLMTWAGPARLADERRLIELLLGGARPVVPEVVNSIGMRLALVPAGKFWMGSPEGEERRGSEEGPRHPVQITRPFYLGVYQVTQRQYQKVTGDNPSWFSPTGSGSDVVLHEDTSDFPVERLSWSQATAFCRRLSARPEEKKAGRVYRLPTEVEWEYACRGAGTSTTPFNFGEQAHADLANFDGRYPYGGARDLPYRQRPIAVGTFRPNVLNLHDMHGNVWEWCSDWYDPAYYKGSPGVDAAGPDEGDEHVLRGGSWIDCGHQCRSAFRDRTWAGARVPHATGMRVLLEWSPRK